MSKSPNTDPDAISSDDEPISDVAVDLENITIEHPGGEDISLADIVEDIIVAHQEIEQYKQGALVLNQAIEEAIIAEEIGEEDEHTLTLMRDVKQSAFGVYLRIKRGDMEVMGNREGPYSGYLLGDEEEDEDEPEEAQG